MLFCGITSNLQSESSNNCLGCLYETGKFVKRKKKNRKETHFLFCPNKLITNKGLCKPSVLSELKDFLFNVAIKI